MLESAESGSGAYFDRAFLNIFAHSSWSQRSRSRLGMRVGEGPESEKIRHHPGGFEVAVQPSNHCLQHADSVLMAIKPFYEADGVTLYHGDMLEIVPQLGIQFDAVVTDPPYNETNLEWDVWPRGWLSVIERVTNSLWCFGSMRMFLDRRAEFASWSFAQDIVWEKHNGSGLHSDRFRRVHELALHFYRGDWESVFKQPPIVTVTENRRRETLIRGKKPDHWGGVEGGTGYEYDGKRLMRSVIAVRSCHGYAVNETQKPDGIVAPLLAYSAPPGGIILDCFAGSGPVLAEARRQGKRAIGVEKRLSQCAEIVKRLSQTEFTLTTT